MLNLVAECGYFLIYTTFLAFYLTSNTTENENKRLVIGYVMIGLICLIICRVLVDLVVSLVEIS
jgi:RsiW-degrading membrane proteinase PrsW (M82 family)